MTATETSSAESKLPTNSQSAPVILALKIERFRGIKTLCWHPERGVNIILGGGDTGKTTVLDAIALLLSPTNPSVLAESDYFERDIKSEFVISAVLELPPSTNISRQFRTSWPWAWDGSKAIVPAVPADGKTVDRPVYCLRVRGTEDLEILYELVQPDGTSAPLSVSLRRAIGLVRLSGDDRNDRDLRLVQGSALDRLLTDPALRSRMSSALASNEISMALLAPGQAALHDLDRQFEQRGLPKGLDLAITGGQGVSIASLVGLTAMQSNIKLPLVSWGAGTRRLAALTIAEQNQATNPVVVDEVERGLEPYRQRVLTGRLEEAESQTFLTTHSPCVLSAVRASKIWYLDASGSLGKLDGTKVRSHLASDPEAFLSRLALVVEGLTEVGFVTYLLEKALGAPLRTHGIHVTDGKGHETCLELLGALSGAGLQFGGFVDDENGKHPEAWGRLEKRSGPLLFRWKSGCVETNMVSALPDDKLESLLLDPEDEKTGARLRTLSERLGIVERTYQDIRAKAGSEFRELLIGAVLGSVPPYIDEKEEKKKYKSHSQCWFKSRSGGEELAEKMFVLDAWPSLKGQLLPFCNAVRHLVRLPDLTDLS